MIGLIGDATGNVALNQFTGFEGIFCGAAAIYTGAAQGLNEVYGKTILPLGRVEQLSSIHVTRRSKETSKAE